MKTDEAAGVPSDEELHRLGATYCDQDRLDAAYIAKRDAAERVAEGLIEGIGGGVLFEYLRARQEVERLEERAQLLRAGAFEQWEE